MRATTRHQEILLGARIFRATPRHPRGKKTHGILPIGATATATATAPALAPAAEAWAVDDAAGWGTHPDRTHRPAHALRVPTPLIAPLRFAPSRGSNVGRAATERTNPHRQVAAPCFRPARFRRERTRQAPRRRRLGTAACARSSSAALATRGAIDGAARGTQAARAAQSPGRGPRPEQPSASSAPKSTHNFTSRSLCALHRILSTIAER